MDENARFENWIAEKWLRVLFCINLASLINSVLSLIPPVPGQLTTWVGRGIMAAAAFCLYQLAQCNGRYQKAALYRAILLAGTLAGAFLIDSSALLAAASVFSILSVYQEYSAHAELIADRDLKLSGKWRGLFWWGLAAGLLMSFGSVIVTVLLIMLELDAAKIASYVLLLLSVPDLAIDILYLGYLRKTVQLLNQEEILE